MNLTGYQSTDQLPVKPAGKPVKPAGIPVRTVSTGEFEFKFAFVRFRPVTNQTGPVNRNWRPAVRCDRSDNKTVAEGGWWEMCGRIRWDSRLAGEGREKRTLMACSAFLSLSSRSRKPPLPCRSRLVLPCGSGFYFFELFWVGLFGWEPLLLSN